MYVDSSPRYAKFARMVTYSRLDVRYREPVSPHRRPKNLDINAG